MFELAWPWLLVLLPLPWLWRWLMPKAKVKPKAGLWVPFFKFAQRSQTSKKLSSTLSFYKYSLMSLIWILTLFAASGPQWLGKPHALPRTGRNIMLAVDLSGSMRIADMRWKNYQVKRLTMVKAVASQFIKQRKNDKLGLVLFGSRAYLQTPLTFDHKTVLSMLNDATIGLAGPQTAIGDAIGLAIKRLIEQTKGSRILILLTDGVNNAGAVEPIPAARMAKKAHVRIYTVGLGADQIIMPSFFGTQLANPSADLDETTLRKIAKMTGGNFFRAKNTRELEQAYHQIDKLEPTRGKAIIFRQIKALYYWPLGLAFCLLLILMLPYLTIWHKRRSHELA